jgi:hypothetical protein|tara:strand:- start:267 stop:398 length:132 start_codon:yes stop_codon:yes gene_type:complete
LLERGLAFGVQPVCLASHRRAGVLDDGGELQSRAVALRACAAG